MASLCLLRDWPALDSLRCLAGAITVAATAAATAVDVG